MNGNTLKNIFATIVMTLCAILIGLTVCLVMKIIPADMYEKVISVLGIPTLFGMIAQSFIHADFNKDGIPDAHQTTSTGEPK